MKKIIALITSLFFLLNVGVATAQTISQKLSGRILLQVRSAGQAWYVNPADGQKYYLGRPADAFFVMRQLGLGISETDFNKLETDNNLMTKIKGKIVIRVQSAGQAYYINPLNGQKYYLGRPTNAFNIMKRLALGITNADLAQIQEGRLVINKLTPPSAAAAESKAPPSSNQSPLTLAAESIRDNNSEQAQLYFIPSLRKAVNYTLKILNADSRLLLANILSGAKLDSQTDAQKIYSATAYFSLGGYDVPLRFYVKKQPDGSWLIANL